LDVIGTNILRLSQSPPPAKFYSPYGFLGLEISKATAKRRWRLGFVYIISLFTFESSIVLNLTKTKTSLMVLEIHTK
jgi:hypothetical protein